MTNTEPRPPPPPSRRTRTPPRRVRDHGLPSDAVYAALRAAGIPRRVNRYGAPIADRAPADVVDQVVARYAAGASIERVAEELGLTLGVVSRVLDERGIKRSRSETAAVGHERSVPATGRREWGEELVGEVVGRYAAGESGEVVARELGLPASSVYRLLRERGCCTKGTSDGSRESRAVRSNLVDGGPFLAPIPNH